jgi:hypothetical protein
MRFGLHPIVTICDKWCQPPPQSGGHRIYMEFAFAVANAISTIIADVFQPIAAAAQSSLFVIIM